MLHSCSREAGSEINLLSIAAQASKIYILSSSLKKETAIPSSIYTI